MRRASLCSAAITCLALAHGPAQGQGLFGLFQQQNTLSYAPSEGNPADAAPQPMNILPVNPNSGAVSRGAATRSGPKAPPSPAALPPEEDEDGEVLAEHDEPKRVRVLLPPPRPGAVQRAAADVAPIGQARWTPPDEQLPPGVNFSNVSIPGLPPAGGNQTLPQAPRVAALPATQSTPRWTLTDEAPLRPPGLRESEVPVANMPGVFASQDASFQCLPMGVKQVLVDTAKRFGHVAILNAQRGRGTGARASYHYQCRAVDFRVRGVPVRTVYNFLREHPNVGGRKIYPMGFFHVDDGPVRSW